MMPIDWVSHLIFVTVMFGMLALALVLFRGVQLGRLHRPSLRVARSLSAVRRRRVLPAAEFDPRRTDSGVGGSETANELRQSQMSARRDYTYKIDDAQ